MADTVGIIGLGIMGGAFSKHLMAAGYVVVGYDVSEVATGKFVADGGIAASSPKAVGDQASVVLLLLPSENALKLVIEAEDGLRNTSRPGVIVVEMSTLGLEAKRAAFDALAASGIPLLDCPISGTGSQAALKDIVLFASGDVASYERCRALFEIISRRQIYLGPFGNGSRLKYIANHLVTVHNVAAGEALAFASKCGMDLRIVLDALTDSAASSKMLMVRGPLMVAGNYHSISATVTMQLKDIQVIGGFAGSIGMPLPLFATAAQHYVAAIGCGLADKDTASVCAVAERMAGIDRED